MQDVGGVLLVILVVAILVAAIIYAQVLARRRREAMAAWARARGLSYSPEKQRSVDGAFPFSCLHKGDNRYAYNVMQGRWREFEVYAFDYHYETHSHDSKGRRQTHTHEFSAAIVTPSFPIKPLLIRTEGFFDKVGEFFGADDIDFELAEFSREFFVKSPDRRWAFDVLHQEAMEFLLHSPRYTMEFQDGSAIAHTGARWTPDAFDAGLKVVCGLIERIPPSVVRELKGSA
jgi:hypothetical protein